MAAAETGADGWTEVARHQRWADADHADFYSIAGDALATVHALEDLAEILAGQVAAYGQGRAVYDDSHVIDPAVRLVDAVAQLRAAYAALRQASPAVNEFWSAIGHIGVRHTPTRDVPRLNGAADGEAAS
ncbi:hypothetical protein ACFFTK_14990 [Pseudonocardia petroleophila]|uniref:Uncharacterized protein n=1 Tax=Pseudonocardia petroleophila TaxID=37331 RepID=A0A7G7MIK3_9PSEU|nr:hypothetical protein [Pseudonocardia petroleophila]QNG52614.1 hypothetical protein H6H00_00535 [Pseudonocardia petroleophila]